jgi:outer membrane protein assembly factor BamD
LYVAKFYIAKQKWIPAINRLKTIVDNYSETVFIEEALHRLVEVYYRVGLIEEAKAAATILGYNYNTSEWYEQSYRVLNKNYKVAQKVVQKKNNGLIKRTIKKILK